jgi:lysophospholipase L1-like esterase
MHNGWANEAKGSIMTAARIVPLLAVFAACAPQSVSQAGSGGSSAGTGGAPAGSGGSTGSGGGATASGGSTGSGGGATASGGATGSGGGATASGGSAGGGGSTGTGGRSGTGGTNGTGGTAGSGGGGTGGRGGAPGSGGGGGTAAINWVGTWTASPYPVDSANQPPAALSNSVLRQIAHVSLGGSRIRVQFSNLSGNGSVTIRSAHIALCRATPAVDSTIDTATDRALAFSGMATVTIAQGMEIWSDPIDFTVPALGNISITTAFGTVPSNLTGHAGSRTTSYQQTASSDVSAASMASAQKTDHWYYISGIDVVADASGKGVVAVGDSITDGRGVDVNRNNRWTDILAARLQANSPTSKVAMMNQSIGASNLVGTSGTAAEARFNRDVLGQSGVRYVIVLDGVNDIIADATFAAMKPVYDKLISQAHARGLLIYGATILPFGGSSYYTAARETVRVQVNAYVKSGAFDGYIDFEAAVTDGANPPKLQAAYATWSLMDGLHPGPAGYQRMGDSVDLTLFTR